MTSAIPKSWNHLCTARTTWTAGRRAGASPSWTSARQRRTDSLFSPPGLGHLPSGLITQRGRVREVEPGWKFVNKATRPYSGAGRVTAGVTFTRSRHSATPPPRPSRTRSGIWERTASYGTAARAGPVAPGALVVSGPRRRPCDRGWAAGCRRRSARCPWRTAARLRDDHRPEAVDDPVRRRLGHLELRSQMAHRQVRVPAGGGHQCLVLQWKAPQPAPVDRIGTLVPRNRRQHSPALGGSAPQSGGSIRSAPPFTVRQSRPACRTRWARR